MPCYTTQHKASGGLDLHARSMDVCILHHAGEIMVHPHGKASPETLLTVLAPYRDDVVVAVACLCTWYGLADLGPREGLAFVRGQALSMQAMHGGTATHDTREAQQSAVLLRGGMLPQASGSPAARRALPRRRMPCRRTGAAWLPPVQHTTSPYTLPEMGTTMAAPAHRAGGAERCPAPAVQHSGAVDLARLGHDDPVRRDVA